MGGIKKVRAQVLAFAAETQRERASKEELLSQLDGLERPFDREGGPVHVTASAIITGTRGTVLHKHKTLAVWLQPGGHIDPGEMPWEAAARETAEETGLRGQYDQHPPSLFHLDVHPARGHVHLDLRYLLQCGDDDPAPGPGESPEVRWFTLDEAVAVADEGLVEALWRLERWRLGLS